MKTFFKFQDWELPAETVSYLPGIRKVFTRSKTKLKRDTGYLGLLLLLALIFCYPLWWPGDLSFYGFDLLRQYAPWHQSAASVQNTLLNDPVSTYHPPHYYPAQHYFQEHLAQGTLPLWNPHVLCGQPFYEYYTNPVQLLFYVLLPLGTAHNLLLFLHLAAIGGFTFLLGRSLGLRPLAAFTSGAAFMFSGYILVWFEHGYNPMLAAMLPLMLWAGRSAVRRPGVVNGLALITGVAYSACIGYPQTAVYQYLLVGVFMGMAAMECRTDWCSDWWKKRLGWGVGAAGAVMLLSLNVIVSSLDLILVHGQRKNLPLDQLFANTGSMPWRYWLTLLYPDAFGNPGWLHTSFTPSGAAGQIYNNYNELCVFSGVIFLTLTVLSLWQWRRRWVKFFWMVAVFVALMVTFTWFYAPLAWTIPGLRQTTPLRILQLYAFAIAMLTGWGVEALCTAATGRQRQRLRLTAMLLAAAAVGLLMFLLTESGRDALTAGMGQVIAAAMRRTMVWSYPAYFGPVLLVLAGVILILLFLCCRTRTGKLWTLSILLAVAIGEMMLFGWRYLPVTSMKEAFPETPGLTFLRQHTSEPWRVIPGMDISCNLLGISGLEEAGGYAAFFLPRFGRIFIATVYPNGERHENNERALQTACYNATFFELCNVRYLVTAPTTKLSPNPLLKPVYAGRDLNVYEDIRAFPRAFFVAEYCPAESADAAFRTVLHSNTRQLATRAVLEQPPSLPIRLAGPTVPRAVPGTVAITAYSSDRIDLAVDCDEPGLAVIGNNWHSGWRAELDRHPVPVVRTNYFMQGVEVPPGHHLLTLSFRPLPAIAAIAVSLSGWLALAAAWVGCGVNAWRRRRSLR